MEAIVDIFFAYAVDNGVQAILPEGFEPSDRK